jgi:hypothetical protein
LIADDAIVANIYNNAGNEDHIGSNNAPSVELEKPAG